MACIELASRKKVMVRALRYASNICFVASLINQQSSLDIFNYMQSLSTGKL